MNIWIKILQLCDLGIYILCVVMKFHDNQQFQILMGFGLKNLNRFIEFFPILQSDARVLGSWNLFNFPNSSSWWYMYNIWTKQVPKGWDKLFVSLVCVETGKTMAKLGKAIVKNGCCQWTETLSESIYISRDDSSKGYQEYLVKLVVSTV